ncbi:hypothetical protein HYPSUDRAFT_916195 [Hypholoma sublateritium FD-334 SS-4]|uniref:Uncharacterized protein n=1 Tax=Hypholoma sublateritium (strain FD-334 SS-4) TaxID=945553 RepID=A0A0D2M6G7_HYPSF|nr:hypothetical protein HYPSUDRAFT_916195 [Hypholoma sublateritium FD-334 SS-4]
MRHLPGLWPSGFGVILVGMPLCFLCRASARITAWPCAAGGRGCLLPPFPFKFTRRSRALRHAVSFHHALRGFIRVHERLCWATYTQRSRGRSADAGILGAPTLALTLTIIALYIAQSLLSVAGQGFDIGLVGVRVALRAFPVYASGAAYAHAHAHA